MSPESIESFFALAIGFALAGVLATGYQLATLRPASFGLLERGPGLAAFAAVPFLAFAARSSSCATPSAGMSLRGAVSPWCWRRP
jgi:hypothetical protein